MSIFFPNNAGTVRFNAGSATINGTGTLFKGYRAGSTISIPGIGSMQLAADPISDTVATGSVAWADATTTFQAFEYHARNEEGVFSDTFVQLLNELRSGNIPALAELDGTGGNKLIKLTGAGTAEAFAAANLISEAAIDGTDGNWLSYFTGAGAKARTALTAKARLFLARTDTVGMQTELGLPATIIMMNKGDLSGTNPNLNTVLEPGIYSFHAGVGTLALNHPFQSRAGTLTVTNTLVGGIGFIKQSYVAGNGFGTKERLGSSNGAVWLPWQTVGIWTDEISGRVMLNATGNYFKKTVVTSSSTHVYDPATRYVEVELVGAGGAGGGANAGGITAASCGSGGGAGGYVVGFFEKLSAVSAVCVIGASASGTAGGNGAVGGSTTFNDGLRGYTANPGAGGAYGGGSSISLAPNGASGGSGAGQFSIFGESGGSGISMGTASTPYTLAISGYGGSSPYGTGGATRAVTADSASAGQSGRGYGSGGSGGVSTNASLVAGGASGPGLIIIREYR